MNKLLLKKLKQTFEDMPMAVTHDTVDNIYIVEPKSGKCELKKLESLHRYKGIVLDEHGKLKFTFIAGSDWNGADDLYYADFNQENKYPDTEDKNDSSYLIKDYKLKKIIARLIEILKFYHAIPVKAQRGSLELNHLYWMLNEIYTQKKSLQKRQNWLGFVQAGMVSKNILDIQHERDIMHEIL